MSARRATLAAEDERPVAADIEYRASLTRKGLEQLRARDPDAFERVLQRLDMTLRARVLEAGDGAWIPFAEHLRVLEAERKVLGDEGFRAFCRDCMKDMWSMPFLEPFLTGVVQVFGVTPETLLRLSARGWMTSFRRGGTLVYETLGLPRCGVLVLSGFPRALLSSGTFELSIAGCFEAYFDLCGTEGEVEVSEEPDALRFIFRWA